MSILTEAKTMSLLEFLAELTTYLTPLSFESKLAFKQIANAITGVELLLGTNFDADSLQVKRQVVDSTAMGVGKILNLTVYCPKQSSQSCITLSGFLNNGRFHRFNSITSTVSY